jgi:gluconolactonase
VTEPPSGPSSVEPGARPPRSGPARNVIVARGLDQPEGPVVLEDGTWLVVEMGPTGAVSSIDRQGHVTRRVHTGRPNGLALMGDDVLIAESRQRSVLRVALADLLEAEVGRTPQPPVTVVASHDDHGRALLFPNDLCIGPDGAIYLTDSGITLEDLLSGVRLSNDMDRGLLDGRLYRIDPASGEVHTLDDGLGHLNGLSFGVDGRLYVNDTLSGEVLRYTLGVQPGQVADRVVFADVIDPSVPPADGPITVIGPDGQAHDRDGNLYVTVVNQAEVVVLGPDGTWIARLGTHGRQPTNVAFGRDEAAIYVTERETGTLQRIDVPTTGLLGVPSQTTRLVHSAPPPSGPPVGTASPPPTPGREEAG